jgi:hypothetical protein
VAQYRSTAQEFAQRGFRSLGVAVKEDGGEWELLGILCMFDPPRADTAAVSAFNVLPQGQTITLSYDRPFKKQKISAL